MAQVVKPEPRHTCSRHQAVERLGETVRMDRFPVRMSNHAIFFAYGASGLRPALVAPGPEHLDGAGVKVD